MAKRTIAICALIGACAAPAGASVLTIGSTNARQCFESADTPLLLPRETDIRHCDEALALDNLTTGDLVATHVNRGILLLRQGHADTAITDFDEAMRLDPNQPEAYLNKGAALIRQHSPGEAVSLFTAALDRNTRRPEVAHYGRAVANEEIGNLRDAYQDYRQASALAPNWSAPRDDLQRFRVVQR